MRPTLLLLCVLVATALVTGGSPGAAVVALLVLRLLVGRNEGERTSSRTA